MNIDLIEFELPNGDIVSVNLEVTIGSDTYDADYPSSRCRNEPAQVEYMTIDSVDYGEVTFYDEDTGEESHTLDFFNMPKEAQEAIHDEAENNLD